MILVAREVGIFSVEQNGSESCELSTNSSFVLVRVPLRVLGEGTRSEAAAFHYSIGPFCGRDTPLALQEGLQTTLRFRVPLELFRARERFSVEVLAGSAVSPWKVLWTKRWEALWQGETPALEPIAD